MAILNNYLKPLFYMIGKVYLIIYGEWSVLFTLYRIQIFSYNQFKVINPVPKFIHITTQIQHTFQQHPIWKDTALKTSKIFSTPDNHRITITIELIIYISKYIGISILSAKHTSFDKWILILIHVKQWFK